MNKNVLKLVPQLRFSHFREDLKKNTLAKIVNFSSGGTPSKANPEYWNGDIPWISASSMYEDILVDSENKITELGLNNGSRLAPKNSILILVRGSILYNRIPIGITGKNVAFNQDVKALEINEAVNQNYLFYWLKYKEHFIKSIVTGTGIGAGKIDTSQLKSLAILLPTIKEQEKIASFLDGVSLRITQLRRQHELLETYKKGVMQKIFSQEIRFKQDDGKPFPDWQKKKLGEVANFHKGKGISKENLVDSGKLKCIRYAELYTFYNEVINNVLSSTNLDSHDLVLSIENDVIIPSSGETSLEIAKAACVKISGVALGGDLNIIRTNIDGCFLAHYLNYYKKNEIARIAQGNTVVHLYNSHLKTISIEIPENEEQEKIANFLSSIDKKIEAVSLQIEKMEEFKRGLLQKMFV